jgi:hypothetical protein
MSAYFNRPVWKRVKNEKRKGRLLKLFFILVFVLIVGNFLFRLPTILKFFNQPFEAYAGEKIGTTGLDTSFRTNVLLISHDSTNLVDAAVASYEPVDQRLTIITLDLKNNQLLKAKLETLFRTGGVADLQKFVSGFLAVPIDRYMVFQSGDLTFSYDNVSKFKKQMESPLFIFETPFLYGDLKKNLKADLTLKDSWVIVQKTKSAKFESKDEVFLSNLTSLDPQNEQVSFLVGNLFLDKAILDEAPSITVQNSSGEAGLASVLANYLSRLGASVVSKESGDETQEENVLIIKNSKPKTEKRLEAIIDFQKKGAKKEDFPGDMLIILGKKASKELTLP